MPVPTHIKDSYPSARQNGAKSFYTVKAGCYRLYLSYDTPIAVKMGEELYITKSKYSVTTSKHLNMVKNLESECLVIAVEQDEIDHHALLFRGI